MSKKKSDELNENDLIPKENDNVSQDTEQFSTTDEEQMTEENKK